MDLGAWLRSLGLERYEATFRDNGVDETVLPSLTAEDLKEMGVSGVGHRRKLLDALALLRTPGAGGSPPSPDAPLAATNLAKDTAERRQVTVMFCDMVGSTALAARLDPEDLRDIIAAYQRTATEVIRRCDGFVAKYLGDGVLVYFGYPQAHEDDAERAVRTGLDVVAAVANLRSQAPLQTRVGIATGLVVVGDLVGSGEAQERGIVGETPNLAARLQGLGEPNTVVIAESTRKLLGTLFELDDLGLKDLKGIAQPVRAWAVTRASSVASRFEAMHASGLTSLIGRDEELDLLLRRWAKAKSGEGQVVLFSGEPGIGKSRLTAALLERLATEPHTRLRYFCSPQHTDSALFPIIGQMERAAGLAREDTPQVKLDKLDALLGQTSTSSGDMALIAEMLSLPSDGRYPVLDLLPQQRRHRTMEALLIQLEGLARQNPVLMILEDAHWIDPTSLEVFSLVVSKLRTIRALLMVTFRQEFVPPWVGRSRVTSITLSRLEERDVEALIDRVVGNQQLPASLRQDIMERSDGIPLFVEEMTKAVLEAGSQRAGEHIVAPALPTPLAVPASLQASLMARLDRLGPAKEVAQVGAAIGREFPHALLAAVVRTPEPDLLAALDRLMQSGLLFRQGVQPHATYLFKHALVQDAAYGTLLREPRRALHARISSVLETCFMETVEINPELLAHHYTEAGLTERAIPFWQRAGERAAQGSANVEAVAHFRQAIALVSTLPPSDATRLQELRLQTRLMGPLSAAKGYASPDVAALYIRSAALSKDGDDPNLILQVLYGQFALTIVGGDIAGGLEMADRFSALAAAQGDPDPTMVAHRIRAVSLFQLGRTCEANDEFANALSLYDATRHAALTYQYGQDHQVAALTLWSVVRWLLGYPDQAAESLSRAIDLGRGRGHANTIGYALAWGGVPVSHFLRDGEAVERHAHELADLAEKRGMTMWPGYARVAIGWSGARAGGYERGLALIRQGLAELEAAGTGVFRTFNLLLLTEVHIAGGATKEALATVDEALVWALRHQDLWLEPELRRRRGLLLLAAGGDTEGESSIGTALELARSHEARSMELRAATSLARLWTERGDRQKARDLLAPVYGWFTEGFSTPDLKEAKALLDELHS
jgi:class 3 adenylate cyclase/predicted ATPase